MDEKPEVIRHQIEETRSALTDKLDTLEREVRGTVRDARDAVTCTVANVRDTVNSTVSNVRETLNSTVEAVREKVEDAAGSVREALNVEHQVQAHPWAVLGGSVAAGYVLGSLLPSDGHGRRRHQPDPSRYIPGVDDLDESRFARTPPPAVHTQSEHRAAGILHGLLEQFEPEIRKVKGLAIGAGVGLIRDRVRQQLPEQLASEFDNLANNVTTKLGGEPIHGSVLEAFGSHTSSESGGSGEHCQEPYAGTASRGRSRDDLGERRFDL